MSAAIGSRSPRADWLEKVTGTAMYNAGLMLWMKSAIIAELELVLAAAGLPE